MQLYNTLSKSVEKFSPISDVVGIYSCGPTVYNHAHIGNLSAYIYADTLRRALHLAGYKTKHVMNFTNVDDKTIRDSHARYPDLSPMDALTKLTRHYEQVFLDEMQAVGNDTSAVNFIRAADYIPRMQHRILQLVEQGYAYPADDGIYFDVARYSKTHTYGQLSKINAATVNRERIANDEYDKASIRDFALWKKQKPGEPAWSFTVAGVDYTGRPGWHIECSVMSTANLSQPFDIHTGGVDLIFPHHENEIAQSTADTKNPLYARYFVHNEHLLVDGHKMSKSAHNFYILPDLINQGFSGLDFRMLVLQSSYQSATNFSWESLAAAHNRLLNWQQAAELRWQLPDTAANNLSAEITSALGDAKHALQNNLDTPTVLRLIDQAFNLFTPTNFSGSALLQLLDFVDYYLGLNIQAATPELDRATADLLAKRQQARAQRDWLESDRLRDELKKCHIAVSDNAAATIWHRTV